MTWKDKLQLKTLKVSTPHLKFSWIFLKNKSRGWKKMFLDCLLVYKSIYLYIYYIKKRWSYDATSLFECPQSPLPPHQQQPISPFHSSLGSSTHSLSSPSPALTSHPCFTGVSAVTYDVKSPKVCSPLCSDHLWQMRVLCVQHTAQLSFFFSLLPSSLRLSSEKKGVRVKDGQSGAVYSDMTNPEGDVSLSLGCCVK